ncbi:MAG TPA: TA system VapC family ribonuclease toxin [Candidatus Acidoferrales bacterium]|nr:TA system VapC family ribonuclease toxin [Candidatus Acidoferrales bacterium]
MKAGFLLDVNVLIAMAWPTHRAHEKVQDWLGRHAREGWATCPLTQTAFVRILSNPAFSPNALTPTDALALLEANLGRPAHRFWPDEVSLVQALEPFAQHLAGHQQVTDAYLLGLAMNKKGKLATLDRAVRALLPDKSPESDFVIVI